ncbi:hypothetical protein FB451DRAFT_1375588 [Mycena latifolia]|nr:hypothetical protein FB451DRAFT_1375588 [Mycena latifolia]
MALSLRRIPHFAMSTSIPYTHRQLRNKYKPELQAIAAAMGLTFDHTKPVLLESIQKYILDHPNLADDPKFLPLFAHRTAAKAAGKNSAHKAAEETVAPLQAPMGANRTLLEQKVKVDPPPQFTKLATEHKPRSTNSLNTKDAVDEDSDSSSLDGASDRGPLTPEPEEKAPKKKKNLTLSKHEIPAAKAPSPVDTAAAPNLDDPLSSAQATSGRTARRVWQLSTSNEANETSQPGSLPPGSLVFNMELDGLGVDISMPFFRDCLSDAPVDGTDNIKSLSTWAGKKGLFTNQVNFFDEHDHATLQRQVPVLSTEVPITVFAAEDGTTRFKTSLSEILPAAIQNDSPIKERGGRIYRPNIRGDSTHHHVRKIDNILLGDCRALNIGEVNEYTLRTSVGGTLHCDVFWDQSPQAVGGTNGGVPTPEGSATDHSAPKASEFVRALFRAQSVLRSLSGSDVPMAIANDRATHNPTGKFAAPGVREAFLRFLHGEMKTNFPDLPEFGKAWPRAKFAGMLLDRFRTQEGVFELFTAWSRPTGGYTVPMNHDKCLVAYNV